MMIDISPKVCSAIPSPHNYGFMVKVMDRTFMSLIELGFYSSVNPLGSHVEPVSLPNHTFSGQA